jgi:ABC-type glycerol-3-phosphate transport system permease component
VNATAANRGGGRSWRAPLLKRSSVVVTVLLLAVLCAAWVYPFLWLVSASLKAPIEVFSKGLDLIPEQWRWENYARAWRTAHFDRYMLNTVLVTVGTVALVVLRSALTGYVLGRYDFIGKRFIIGMFIATFIVPAGYTIIPIVDLTQRLGLLNTLWGIVLALGGGGHVASILLYAGYFSQVPKELEEAAILDGAGFLDIFFRVMLPLAGPITATVSVLTFLFAWNSFFVPLVFTFSQPDLRTLAVGMLAFVGTNETDWPGMAAAATLSLLPVVAFFFFVQRYFIEGIAGAVKG